MAGSQTTLNEDDDDLVMKNSSEEDTAQLVSQVSFKARAMLFPNSN